MRRGMTVRELIAALSKCEIDAQVVLAGDYEGNTKNLLGEVDDSGALSEGGATVHGCGVETGIAVIEPPYDAEDFAGGPRVVILWPGAVEEK